MKFKLAQVTVPFIGTNAINKIYFHAEGIHLSSQKIWLLCFCAQNHSTDNFSSFCSVLIADIIHSTLHCDALLFTTTMWFKSAKPNSSLSHNGSSPLEAQLTYTSMQRQGFNTASFTRQLQL